MSSTRKMKLQDRGAPEPKPSRKVVLDELLRSLQDLVHNELAVDSPAGPSATAPPDAGEAIGPAATDNPEPVAVADATVEAPVPPAEDLEAARLEALPPPEPAPMPVAVPTTPAAVPPEGLQQELPYLDATSAAAGSTVDDGAALLVEPPMEIPDLPATEPPAALSPASADEATLPAEPPIEIPDLPTAGLADREPPTAAVAAADAAADPDQLPDLEPAALAPAMGRLPAAPLTGDEFSPSDIPLLEDAVELPDSLAPVAATGATTLPPAGARRLAIQVAARLNVELRKQGKSVLASDVIARLAHLLEEALAKVAANMDNTPPEKP